VDKVLEDPAMDRYKGSELGGVFSVPMLEVRDKPSTGMGDGPKPIHSQFGYIVVPVSHAGRLPHLV